MDGVVDVNKSLRRLIRGITLKRERFLFDPIYYVHRYADLAGLGTTREAKRHYTRHGKREGRFPNRYQEEEANFRKYLTKSSEFDVRAYRELNGDLAKHFSSDRDYIIHFLRHGREERRPATFNSTGGSRRPVGLESLSISQFSAWASDWIEGDRTVDGIVQGFEGEGIRRLAPIRFDLEFDPAFYRDHYGIKDSDDDVVLYRDWIYDGQYKGRVPNENRLLDPYIGGSKYPDSFDWQGYSGSTGSGGRYSRAAALIYAFETERDHSDFARRFGSDRERINLVSAIVRYKFSRGRAKEAETALNTSGLSSDQWTSRLWAQAAAIHASLGRDGEAVAASQKALLLGDGDFETVSRLVGLSVKAKDFRAALAVLKEQRSKWIHTPQFEKLAQNLAQSIFESSSADLHDALRRAESGRTLSNPPTGDHERAMYRSLELVAQCIEELDVLPGKIPLKADGHVVILGNYDIAQCKRYRIDQRIAGLKSVGIRARSYPNADSSSFIADLIGARAAIFYRVPATPSVIKAILAARHMGIPTFYDIDDLIFCSQHYPPSYSSYEGSISREDYRGLQFGVPLFSFAMSLCDEAISSTTALLSKMIALVGDKKGLVLRNGWDESNVPTMPLGEKSRDQDQARIRIFYGSGTLAHNADYLDLVAPAISRIMDLNDKVDLVLVGHVVDSPDLRDHSDRVIRFPIISDMNEYWAVLAGCDINIAPLHPNAVNHCKSEIKWLEAGLLGVPTIASDTHTYQEVIEHRHDGIIARDPQEWFSSLKELCDDRELRRKIASNARSKALSSYSGVSIHAAMLSRLLKDATTPEASTLLRKPRVLICNVFFSPQSLGGATRVVEDNVRILSESYSDIDVAVICTDTNLEIGAEIRMSDYYGVPVFRVCSVGRPSDEIFPFADDFLSGFRKVLDQFDPDLVHFHCVQRFSGSVVVECFGRNIPYIVTLHDGFWISEHQFLVDGDGCLDIPKEDKFSFPYRDVDFGRERIARRQSLEALLRGAVRVVAVSEAFAEIHRAAGLEFVTAIPNGVPSLPSATRPSVRTGRLRLAMIGGRSSHKGADLVEAAIRLGRFNNLHLTLVDGRLSPGEVVEAEWGTTPVSIIAPVSQHEVQGLYEQADVLLAPSRWPESFGLVAREAMHFGLWVVGSDFGAMADDVIEGENGFRIDTSSRRDLDLALAKLDAFPDLYRRSADRCLDPGRSVKDQVDDLVVLYRSVLQDRH